MTDISSASDHAQERAATLRSEVEELLTQSKYPVINPEVLLIESCETQSYNRKTRTYQSLSSAPRVWLSDTLRVAPIESARGKTFIFTGAQNDAPLHEAFWNNLRAYAASIKGGADLVVGPWTYETQWWSENNPAARSYDPRISQHLCFGQMRIGENFVFCGEMNTLPTANTPVSDLVTYPRNRWAVFPHAKRQLKSVPSTDPSVQAHQVMTTGAVTRPKVVPRKAGVKSLFHQILGATIVEFNENGDVFCRQITANEDGSFYDLDRHVANGVVTSGHRVRALVCGDIHTRKLDRRNALATFGFAGPSEPETNQESVLAVLNPEHVFLHDIFDHESRNHHNAGDPLYGMRMHEMGRASVHGEILEVTDLLEKLDRTDRTTVVVESNHDIALDRYIREGRHRQDAPNYRFGLRLETALQNHESEVGMSLMADDTPPKFSLLEYAVRHECVGNIPNTKWAYDNASYLVDGIECGHHGFRGANGAKGTVQGFARTGRKLSIGDKHSPEINEGVYVAGAMTLQQGYNKGPSSWAVSHIVQYADGSRSIITLQNGQWRA